jgi:hypothetical protein
MLYAKLIESKNSLSENTNILDADTALRGAGEQHVFACLSPTALMGRAPRAARFTRTPMGSSRSVGPIVPVQRHVALGTPAATDGRAMNRCAQSVLLDYARVTLFRDLIASCHFN